MKGRWWLWLGAVVLFILHNDVWWWHDPRLVLGLPIGLAYHLAFCLATAVLMAFGARTLDGEE